MKIVNKWNYAEGGENSVESKVVRSLQLGIPTYARRNEQMKRCVQP